MARDKIKWKGFVKCNLSVEDKRQLLNIFESVSLEKMLDDVGHIVAEGFAFSLKPPTENTQSFAASFRGIDPSSENAGWMLTGWGGDAVSAIVVLLYKHVTLLDGDYSSGGIADDGITDMFG